MVVPAAAGGGGNQPPPGNQPIPLPSVFSSNPTLANQAQQAATANGSPGLSGFSGTTSYGVMANLLLGTSNDVTGRYGLTGQPNYQGNQPAWLGLSPSDYQMAQSSNNFDPWYGILSDNGADDKVYMGTDVVTKHHTVTTPAHVVRAGETIPAPPREFTSSHKVKTDKTLTVTQALNIPMSWDSNKVAEVMKKMNDSGFHVRSFDEMTNVWGALVQRASGMYAYSEGKNKVTPWDVLSMYGDEAVKAGIINADGSPINPLAGTTHTSITKTVSDITQGDAWSALKGTLTQLLGRDPTDREARDFAYRMNSLAARNPSISKEVIHYNQNGDPHTTRTSEQGFSAGDVAQAAYNQAQDDPNYAEHQAATTYYNAALSALGAIGQVG